MGTGDAADIVAITENQEREHGDHGMLQGVNCPHEVHLAVFEQPTLLVSEVEPQSFCLDNLFRQIQRRGGGNLQGEVVYLRIAGNLLRYLEPPPGDPAAENRFACVALEDLCFLVDMGPGMKIRTKFPDHHFPAFKV